MRDFQKNKTNAFFSLISLPSTAMGFALSIQISALSWILITQYGLDIHDVGLVLSLIHISEPTRPFTLSRMPSSA